MRMRSKMSQVKINLNMFKMTSLVSEPSRGSILMWSLLKLKKMQPDRLKRMRRKKCRV